MAATYATLFWCALQVTIFLSLATPIYLFARRRNPQAATFAAATSLGAVVVLSALAASPWPRWTLVLEGRGGAAPMPTSSRGAPTASGDRSNSTAANVAVPTAEEVAANSDTPLTALWKGVELAATPGATMADNGAPPVEETRRWPSLLAALFIAGAAISGAHLAAGLMSVRRLRAAGRTVGDAALAKELHRLRRELRIDGPVLLLESSGIATPATVGWRRPAILLPPTWRAWNDVERRAVLAHELAHIAQHDFATWLIARAAIAVHFYHPLVRWFAGRLQLDQELSADAAAADLLGDRRQYLRTLASLALATPTHRLAGPARAFIPGRSLLVRRVEMLRTNADTRPTIRSSSKLRWAIAPVLAATAVIAGGLRPSTTRPIRAAELETAAEKQPATSESGYVFSYVPNDFILLLAIRPSEIAASAHLKALAELMNEALSPRLTFEELEQATFVVPAPVNDERGATIPGTGSGYTIYRTRQPIDFKSRIEASYGAVRSEEYEGAQIIAWADPKDLAEIEFYSPEAGTLIGTPRVQLTPVIKNPKSAEPPAAAVQWVAEATGPMFGVVDLTKLKATLAGRSASPFLPLFQPVFDQADQATVSVEDGDPLTLTARFSCRNAEDASRVEETLQAGLVMIKNVLAAQRTQLANAPADVRPDMTSLLALADELMASIKTNVNGARVDVTASVKNPSEALRQLLLPQLRRARQAAEVAQSMNNLRQLGLAAHIFLSRFRTFPTAVFYGKSSYGDLNKSGDAATDVPRSWRVEILPLIGEEKLYQEYRLDQPWDSEANLAVLRKMPATYRSSHQPADSTNAAYFAVVGPGTIMGGKEGTPLEAIADGASNTILLVEAERDIPWTKPQDVEYDPAQEAPRLGGWGNATFAVVYADGSAHQVAADAFKSEAGRNNFRRLVQFADGEAAERLESR
jgi:beta-lactamase regulating signal transducer with metallopeptidase domain